MKHHLISLARVLMSATVILGIVGCLQENPVDTEEEEGGTVGADLIGQLAAQTLASGTESASGASAYSSEVVALLDVDATIPDIKTPPPGLGLGKRAARHNESLVIDESDPANPLAVYTVCDTSILGVATCDTAIVKWDALAQDNIAGNENITYLARVESYPLGRTEYYTVRDADGDGVVAGGDACRGVARATARVANGSTVESFAIDIDCGPDNSFRTVADNKVKAMGWTRTRSGQTVAQAAFTDADGDGYLLDNASTAPATVDVSFAEKDPVFEPWVASADLAMRVEIAPDRTGRVTGLNGTQTLRTGRVNAVAVSDSRDGTGDGVLDPDERAFVTWTTKSSPAGDPVSSGEVTVVLDPGSGIEHAEDNLYYEVHCSEERRRGPIASSAFSFTTSEPITDGRVPMNGHIQMTVTSGAGETYSVVADYNGGAFSGTYTGPDGQSFTISWDADGGVVTQSNG